MTSSDTLTHPDALARIQMLRLLDQPPTHRPGTDNTERSDAGESIRGPVGEQPALARRAA